MSSWIDRHSINCCICDELIDEREAIAITGGGSFCGVHHQEIVYRLRKLCKYLRQATTRNIVLDDNETEIIETDDDCYTIPLDDALAMLREHITTDRTQPGYVLWKSLTSLIGV